VIVGRVAIFFKMTFNAMAIGYIVISRWHSWHQTLRLEAGSLLIGGGVGGGRNLGGEGGAGAGVGVADVASEGGDGGIDVPGVEDVEGICGGDANGDVSVVVGEGGVSVDEDGEGGYRRWGRAVGALPPHTPPSVVLPRIFI
jgi:hypothetical protein